eukprot:5553084-Pyramimonas_sp.AAC.2
MVWMLRAVMCTLRAVMWTLRAVMWTLRVVMWTLRTVMWTLRTVTWTLWAVVTWALVERLKRVAPHMAVFSEYSIAEIGTVSIGEVVPRAVGEEGGKVIIHTLKWIINMQR